MSNNLTVAIALAAGLAGGLLVLAQTPAQTAVPNEIRAHSFTLVDQFGEVAGTFTSDTQGPRGPKRIVLKDTNGREIWSAGGSALRPLMAKPN